MRWDLVDVGYASCINSGWSDAAFMGRNKKQGAEMIFDFSNRRADPLENPSNALTLSEFSDYIMTSSGASVSENTAMKLAAVYSCIYVLSSSVAQLPLHVMRKQDKTINKATDHAAYYLLHDSANQWQSSYDWRETKMTHAAGWGNGYTRLIRNRRTGELEDLRLALPWSTSLTKRSNGRYIYSVADEDEGSLAVQPTDMLHVRAIGSTGKLGVSPIRQNAQTIGLGQASLNYGNKFFNGGGKPTGIISLKSAINSDSWARFKELWKKAKSQFETDNNNTMLLPAEVDYSAISIPPEDAQFLETRKFNRSEIAGIFNVPAHMINDLEKATFSNISEQAIQFVRHSIMPWVVKWEQEINRKVFTESERRAGYYAKFNLAGLLRGTPKERADYYHLAITDGWMNRNEARVFEELNPVDGLEDFLVSVNAAQPQQGKKNESE